MKKSVKKFIKISLILIGCIVSIILILPLTLKSSKNPELLMKVSNGRQLYLLLADYKNNHSVFPSKLNQVNFKDLEDLSLSQKLQVDLTNWHYQVTNNGDAFTLTANIKNKKVIVSIDGLASIQDK